MLLLAGQQLMDLQLVLFLLYLTLTLSPDQPWWLLLHQHRGYMIEGVVEGMRILESRVCVAANEAFVHFVDVEGLEQVGVV